MVETNGHIVGEMIPSAPPRLIDEIFNPSFHLFLSDGYEKLRLARSLRLLFG
jgi:hypothetical protein